VDIRENMHDPIEKVEYGIGGELIIDVVLVWDNIAVNVNKSSNENFWFMLVDKQVHIVEESFIDACDNTYLKGKMILRGYWYDILRLGSHTYVLRNDKPLAHVYSHLVSASWTKR
jgi:hypothetical protein